MAQLTTFGHEALKHWKKHRPRMAAKLKKMGVLEQAAIEAQERTEELILDLMAKGLMLWEAKEIAMPRLIYLPSEEEEPTLSPDRLPYGLSNE